MQKKISFYFMIMLFLISCFMINGLDQELVILHTNDTHGHPVQFFDYPGPGVGGLPARASLVQSIKTQFKNVLILDAGDLNTGRPESNFFKAEPDIIGYNYIGYDAMVLGNHEFDISIPDLKKQMKQANFPFISANVKLKNGQYFTQPYIIKEFKGFKVGIFGLTTKETEVIGNPQIIGDLVFEDEVKAARKMVRLLKKKADIIIALAHLGIYSSDNEGSKRVAKMVKGIDIIIDGHSHTKMTEPLKIKNTYIVQAWHWGIVVGKAIVTVSKGKMQNFEWVPVTVNQKKKIKLENGKSQIVTVGGEVIPQDPQLAKRLQPYVDQVEAILSEEIGEAGKSFFNQESRKMETAIGDLVSDAMLWYTQQHKVDFAIQNGGGIRADLPEGKIRKKTIHEVLPFDNTVVVLTLKGEQVQQLFDYIATIPQGKGAFAQVSGVTYTINYKTGKCEDIMIKNAPLNKNKTYKIVTNSYMANGGDGYEVFKKNIHYYDSSVYQRAVLIDYIQKLNQKLQPEVKNRIKIITNQ